MVGERGVTLFGGQKQRAAIARALLRRPAILILDDALASVIPILKSAFWAACRNTRLTSTTILISHRVQQCANADQIAVLSADVLSSWATHDELLARDGYYASLYQKQQLEEELYGGWVKASQRVGIFTLSSSSAWRVPGRRYFLQ